MECSFEWTFCSWILLFVWCLTHGFSIGSSAAYWWTVSCGAKATGSSMPPGSMHCSRDCNLLGNAACYEFSKPYVSNIKLTGFYIQLF